MDKRLSIILPKIQMIYLNKNFSTTRLLTKERPEIVNKSEDKFDTILFLQEGEGRKGEGGLRIKGFFKNSYRMINDKWFIVDHDDNPINEINLYDIAINNSEWESREALPLISIVTVVYNGEKYLEETIRSVINQTYYNVEYIIIDGGSSDGTVDIIKKHEDYIDYWVSEKDNGIYDAMNKGMDLATGKWINFMNAGDKFYSKNVINSVFTENIIKNVVFGKSLTYYGNLSSLRYKSFSTEHTAWYLKKLPNHQAVFISYNLYKKNKFDIRYKFNADTVYLRNIFSQNDFEEKQIIVSYFELGGKSNYYGGSKTFLRIVKESIMMEGKVFKPFFSHFVKYVLQLLLGRNLYLRFYIKFLVKN